MKKKFLDFFNFNKNKIGNKLPSSYCSDELQKVIEYTKSAFDSLEQGILIYSPDFRLQGGNELIKEIIGLEEEEVIGKLFSEIFDVIKYPEIEKQLDDVIKGKKPYDLEYTIEINGTGEEFVIKKIAKAILDSKGKIIGILGIVKNITKDIQKENTELEKDFFLKESQEKAGIGSYKADFVTGLRYGSTTIDSIFGIDETYDKTLQLWFESIHPDDLEKVKYYYENDILGMGKKFDKEYRIIRKDNQEVCWIHGLGEVARDSQNRIISLMGTIQDITERKKIEEKLRKTSELLLSITNGTTDMIFTKDLEGRYTSVNKAFQNFLGMQESEIIGEINLDIFQMHNDKQFLITDKEIIDAGKCITKEGRLKIGKDGYIELSIMKGPMYDSEGKLSGFFAIVRDITEKKANVELLAIANEQLQIRQKMDSLGTLAGGIGHEFNNLLSGIMGNLDLALRDGNISEKTKKYTKNSLKICHRAAKLVKQLQYLSKNSISEIVNFDIYNVTSEVFNLLEKTTSKLVKKEIDFEPGEFYINGSESEIHQVLLNLGTNSDLAIEERGHKEGDFIKIKAENYRSLPKDKTNLPEGDYVHILFKDSGKGMPDDISIKAFDPFFTTRETGQGYGLAIVYNIIVHKHNGHIFIESKEGLGTTIHLYLPKTIKHEKTTPEKILKVSGGKETILVIEDEEGIKDFVKIALERFGYKVLTAKDGQEGLDMYIKDKKFIDLVLLDLRMPKMGGETVLENILKINEDVRVIISSGQKNEGTNGILGKAKGFVAKPYLLNELKKIVREVLDEEK